MRHLWLFVVLVLSAVSSACEFIGDVFQAGMAVGVIAVVLVVILIGFIVSRLRR